MDGCTIYGVLVRIVLPMIKSAVVTNVVIQFIFRWNDLIFAMTFINSKRLKTVQTGLLYFTGEWGSKEWGPIFAAISMGVLPILGMYLVLNKLVIKGMTAGSVKG
jgi:raffinose/stachyose/melibiose transport system permease protein